MAIKELRRMVEMAYSYAWGVAGTDVLRDEFNKNYKLLQRAYAIGTFAYCGNNRFEWSD